MTPYRPGFTGYTLDRADHLRSDADAVTALAADWRARLLPLNGYDPIVSADGRLEWASIVDAPEGAALILLGLDGDRPHFVALPAQADGAALFRSPRIMQVLATLSPDDIAIYGAARSLIDWHLRHQFCGRCGAATIVTRAGWGRTCSGCKTEHFPRVDPVVIMLAEHDGRALVGRQAAWPQGRYSALAGFLEPGETIEEAVARELFEEAGVRATEVRYVTSQPWPFPAQLMLACVAKVDSAALTLAPAEIEDALWVTRAEVRAALAGDADAKFIAPPHYAVAHSLLTHWAAS
jgi:NAD+ diphosphatase